MQRFAVCFTYERDIIGRYQTIAPHFTPSVQQIRLADGRLYKHADGQQYALTKQLL